MAVKLAHMKLSAADKKAQQERWKSPTPADSDDYPEGLRIRLDDAGMKKVGMNDMPSSGDEYHGEFHGRVVRTSDESADGSDPQRSVHILLHHVGVEPRQTEKGDGKDDAPRSGLRSTIEKAAEKADKATTKAD